MQWRLPELVLWPAGSASTREEVYEESAALRELRAGCAKLRTPAARPGVGLDGCMRGVWLHNLTNFLSARKKAGGGAKSVG